MLMKLIKLIKKLFPKKKLVLKDKRLRYIRFSRMLLIIIRKNYLIKKSVLKKKLVNTKMNNINKLNQVMKKMILHIIKDKYSNFAKEFTGQSKRNQERIKAIFNNY